MKLLASASPGELRVAAWNGALADYAIHRPGAPDGVGDLHRGRVTAVVPAMAGAFVALDGAEGFLPDSEGAAPEGTVLGVRITRAAQGGKGPRLSARIGAEEQALVGQGAPALLRRGPDALARLAALHPHAEIVHGGFPEAVEDEIARLAERLVALPGGVTLQIHPTPALVAIDVDLAPTGRRGKASSQLAGNRAVLPALARQIRLRNLGGAILVDLAGMALRKRAALAPEVVAALADDPLAPRFLGFSALGLMEILRPRVHKPLHELLAGPHAAGLAALRALARTIARTPWHPPVLHVTRPIADALQADAQALSEMAAACGQKLRLITHTALPAPGWSLEEPIRD